MTSSTNIRRIKIVHLVTSLEVGGAQHNMLLGLPRLDPAKYEHILVSIMDRMQMESQFRQLGIEVHSLGLSKKTDIAVALRLRSLLRRIRPDILHTYLIHGNVLGRIVGRLAGIPAIIGSELTIGQAGTIGKLATKLTNPLTNAVEVNSKTGGKAITKNLGVPTDKIEVILPGLDLDAFTGTTNRTRIRHEIGVSENQHLVLFVGRLRPVKGPEYGIKAFTKALSENSNLHLALAGEGEQRAYLQTLTADLGIQSNITFLGARKDLPDVLSAADSILMPSLTEGFPRVANEAMAASKPVIATRVGGVPEAIIHDETGLLVESKNIEAMADAILRLSSDTDLQERLGRTARQHAEEHYSAASYVARLDNMYSRWANLKAPSQPTTATRSSIK
ncbi:glycosyltransferase [Candidatus Lucifugimonas marina]|uniref:Glycosyltransferase n=1 Tax=Candidatus Lucifugimonas marina TaxID=3038979 RepID=A0AAJ5ZGC5_9CHLR|nr:glycosyltransferase [SAR202 cluster bacterium JH702]MDG0868225.1 glycosyltransferase [SAR202 cluster bacterium JH639]WFG34869.1 glycosyltransferase [SAR202 cluster bacterium JH545]WFG38820.1 glycosyltransferase [SAR202 cluster bacterium JH1073]